MSTSQSKANSFPIALLGIPVTNRSLSDVAADCLQRIQENRQEGKVSYYLPIHDAMIDICYGWRPTIVDHPELLSILRHASFSSISGKYLSCLGRLMGASMAPAYTAQEFIYAFCEALGDRKIGIFFLGDHEKMIKTAAVHLHDKYPQLRLVGIAAPPIFVEGTDLETASERDALLIEQINASHADVLVINLTDLAQELWLERVKEELTVPLVLMAGKSLINPETSPSSSLRQPQKKTNHENISLLPKQPSCTLIGKIKLLWIAFPLVLYHHCNRFLHKMLPAKNKVPRTNRLFLSAYRSVAEIPLPSFIDSSYLNTLWQLFEESSGHDVLLFDFREVRHIEPEGFYFLIKSWLRRSKDNKEVYGFQPTDGIIKLMKWHHTWDLFKHTLCESPEALFSRLKAHDKATFYDAFVQAENLVTISLLGALDHQIDYTDYIRKLIPIIGSKNCQMDFSYCSYIDNTGLAFLLNLRKHLQAQQQHLTLIELAPNLKALFRAASVTELFE